MASEAELAKLIQLGHDITSLKLYALSVTVLWAYDYLLTLKDEVRYAWKTEGVFIFVIFLSTRYLPGIFQVWLVVSYLHPGYTSEVFLMCKKAGFLLVLHYTLIHTAAQIVLAQRTYAITRKNKWIAGILYTISAVQLGVGLFLVIRSVTNPGAIPNIPLDSYHLCLTGSVNIKGFAILQMSLSIIFDIVVFVSIIVQTKPAISTLNGMNRSNILDRVTRDAEVYFVVISTAHLLVLIMFAVARPLLRAVPVVGNAVLVPIMISRMIMSLKKASSSQRPLMSIETPAGLPINLRDTHSHRVDNIQLSVFKS